MSGDELVLSEGRCVSTGPPSMRKRGAERMWARVGSCLAVLVGAAASFVLVTTMHDVVPDALLIAAGLLPAGVVGLLIGIPVRGGGDSNSPISLTLPALGGVLAFVGAPLLALSQRATDAPTGSESLLFSVVIWGVLLAIAGSASWGRTGLPRFMPGSPVSIAAALAALAGSMTVLACWERPSSFSPFVKYPRQESIMLGAGALFVLGVLLVTRDIRRVGFRRTVSIATVAASFVSLLLLLPGFTGVWSVMTGPHGGQLLLAGAANALFIHGVISLAARGSSASAGAAMACTPAAMTMIAVIERHVGVLGPSPFVLDGVVAGSLVSVTAMAVTFAIDHIHDGGPDARDEDIELSPRTGITRRTGISLIAALIAVCVMAVAPGVVAEVRGYLGEPFEARWTLPGYKSAIGWLMMASIVSLLSIVVSSRSSSAVRSGGALLALGCAAASLFVADVPFQTWTRWIPADIQQVYGTEYATITFQRVAPWGWTAVAVMCGCIAVVSLLWTARVSFVRKGER